MKIDEIINYPSKLHGKRYIKISTDILIRLEKIKELYYISGVLPSYDEMIEIKDIVDFLNYKIRKIIRQHRLTRSAWESIYVLQHIESIISELENNIKESRLNI
jgi:hypothetical protein